LLCVRWIHSIKRHPRESPRTPVASETIMNLTVRPARLDDAPVIVEFNRRMARETEHKDLDLALLVPGVEAMLRDPAKGRYFVAEAAGHAVGQLGVTLEWSDWRNGNFWWIQSVYVAPDARRLGVFRMLYNPALQTARTPPNVIGIRLYVENDNRVAQA